MTIHFLWHTEVGRLFYVIRPIDASLYTLSKGESRGPERFIPRIKTRFVIGNIFQTVCLFSIGKVLFCQYWGIIPFTARPYSCSPVICLWSRNVCRHILVQQENFNMSYRFYCVIYVSLDFLLHKASQIRYDIIELILGFSTNSAQYYVLFFVLFFINIKRRTSLTSCYAKSLTVEKTLIPPTTEWVRFIVSV